MIVPRPLINLMVMLLIIGPAGCIGRGSPIHQYTLAAMAESGAPPVLKYNGRGVILVGPVTLPQQFAGSSIVTRFGPTVIRSSSTHLWAAPLDEQIAAVISRDLSLLLQSGNVSVYPGPRFAEKRYQVDLAIDRFDGMPGKEFTCNLTWTINDLQTRKIIQRKNFSLTIPVNEDNYGAYVTAASTVISRLCAAELAPAVSHLQGLK